MAVCVVTGSAGLVGSQAVRHFASLGMRVVGIDNDMRRRFFGADGSTAWSARRLEREVRGYRHLGVDIRDERSVGAVLAREGRDVQLVVHAAAQPSHDWATRDPLVDFGVNATGTLILLDAVRRHCPEAVFVFVSTNKVYGDSPNRLPFVELETRWEPEPGHPVREHGIDESMPIDRGRHSLMGASKLAADVMVQEYARSFGMATGVFRCGCITGPGHSAVPLHGFLSHLMRCAVTGTPYTVFGYGAKQVRDNLHCADLVRAFECFWRDPRHGEVYNLGGGRESSCSVLEGIELCEQLAGRRVHWTYEPQERGGDHRWWVSDVRRFRAHYPAWDPRSGLRATLQEIHDELLARLRTRPTARSRPVIAAASGRAPGA